MLPDSLGGEREAFRVEMVATAERAQATGDAEPARRRSVRRARTPLGHVAGGKLGLVERPRVHASGSLATLALAGVCKQTPPRCSRTPSCLQDLPSPDRLLPTPRKCLAA